MSKGFVWVCQNNKDTDYIKLSIELARTLKKHNKQNLICVIVDEKSLFQSEYVDHLKVLRHDESSDHDKKFANEYKVFDISPFTHTIKLEADMLWNSNTDWWWNYLCQHDLVFSVDCLNYKQQIIRDDVYRPYHRDNFLPNIYNGMTYFRKSIRAKKFYELCKYITQNWQVVKEEILKRCFDDEPTTDIVYALAYRLLDPINQHLINYKWFKFIHNKPSIHQTRYRYEPSNYYFPVRINDEIIFGGYKITAPLHYFYKDFLEVLNVRSV